MKIVVIGGSGLIGKKLIPILKKNGHDVLSASPSSGVNAVTGQGLDTALAGADIVVDVSNSPSFEEHAVMKFFVDSTTNLLAAEAEAGVSHHVALSVVGADRLTDSPYMRAKLAQENLIIHSSIPYTILRATQFFEFLGAIAGPDNDSHSVRLPTAPMQPVAAQDVASTLADIATAAPTNNIVELAGPESLSIADFVGKFLQARGDTRTVIADPKAQYFGASLGSRGLNPEHDPRLGKYHFTEWFSQNA